MSTFPATGTPEVIFLGTDDKSKRLKPYVKPPKATHVPLFIMYTEKGPLGKKEYVGENLTQLYGEKTFDPTSPYFTAANMFASVIMGQGNPLVVQRVLPADAMTKIANVTVYLDVLPESLPIYKRYEDGSIVLDSNGDPVQDGDKTIDGYKVKIITEYDPNFNPNTSLGNKTTKPGTMTDANGNKSTMTPIIEYKAKYQGGYYNKLGFAYELQNKDEVTDDFIEGLKALPYNLYMYEKEDDGTSSMVSNLFGAKKAVFSFKPDAKDPATNLAITLKDTTGLWFNETEDDLPYKPWDIEEPYVYNDNLKSLLDKFIQAEAPYINANVTAVGSDGSDVTVNTSAWFDFIPGVDLTEQSYLYNPFNGFSLKRVPYFAVVRDTDSAVLTETQDEAFFSASIPVFLNGGTDGDLSMINLESEIGKIMEQYADPNSKYMNMALNPENIFYDVGYTLDLKKKLINFIKIRKDTALVLSTRQWTDKQPNDIVTDRAIAINLKTLLNLAPESIYFGTGVARAIVVMGTGKIKNWLNNDYYPLTFDIAYKSARMMGGPKWDREELFDRGGRNIIKTMYDVKPESIPQGVKPVLWNVGLIYPDNSDLNQWFFPALQTVYDNDTSVLNSYFTIIALTVINKIAFKLWVKYTGNVELTPAELMDALRNDANQELKGKFADLIKVVPDPVITNFDKATGYSWTMRFELYANVPTTVMRTYTVAFRKEDLAK